MLILRSDRVNLNGQSAACPRCHGKGCEPDDPCLCCENCNGAGRVRFVVAPAPGADGEITRAADLVAWLDGLRYTPGTPEDGCAEAVAADATLCAELECPGCGRRGMAYLPFTSGETYRAVAVCVCGVGEVV